MAMITNNYFHRTSHADNINLLFMKHNDHANFHCIIPQTITLVLYMWCLLLPRERYPRSPIFIYQTAGIRYSVTQIYGFCVATTAGTTSQMPDTILQLCHIIANYRETYAAISFKFMLFVKAEYRAINWRYIGLTWTSIHAYNVHFIGFVDVNLYGHYFNAIWYIIISIIVHDIWSHVFSLW